MGGKGFFDLDDVNVAQLQAEEKVKPLMQRPKEMLGKIEEMWQDGIRRGFGHAFAQVALLLLWDVLTSSNRCLTSSNNVRY